MPKNGGSRGPQTKFWAFTSFKETIFTTEEKHDFQCSYFVCQLERTPDTGRLHWQGYLELKVRGFTTKVQRIIDDPTAHCSERYRNSTGEKNKIYCTKTATTVEPVQRFEYGTVEPSKGSKRGFDVIAQEAIGTGSYERAVKHLCQQAPGTLLKSWYNITGGLKALLPEPDKVFTYKPVYSWKLPTGLESWIREEFPKQERARCLILIGPTRLGKTAWARSLGRHMFWRGNVAYGEWDDESKYLVIDDVPWKYIPHKKSILTQMGTVTLTDKYVKKLTVLNNKPAIFLTNDEPDFENETEYWERNTTIIRLTEKLFDETQSALPLQANT